MPGGSGNSSFERCRYRRPYAEPNFLTPMPRIEAKPRPGHFVGYEVPESFVALDQTLVTHLTGGGISR
jgi:hypothetical protein